MIFLLLAACNPAAEEPSSNQANQANQVEQPPAEKEAAAVPSLEGQWRVTAINGAPLTQYYAMNANFGADRLTISSECVSLAWDFRQDRNIVNFALENVSTCRERTHNEDEIEEVVTLANIAMFSDEGRQVELSGPGGSATMTRR